jgi:hypothetical protein
MVGGQNQQVAIRQYFMVHNHHTVWG